MTTTPKTTTKAPPSKPAAKKAATKKPPTKPKADAKSAAKPPANPRKPKVSKPVGRPSDYSPKVADAICLLLAEGMSLRAVCADESMPDKSTVLRWIARHSAFRDQYARAKQEGAEAVAEEMFEIADDGTNDWMERFGKEGDSLGWQLNGEHVQRSRLRIETRKWYLSKIMPKKYGDKVDVSHGVEEGNPLLTLMGQLSGKVLKPVADDE